MSSFPTKHERIKIIPANDSELAEESLARIEFYQRYWAVESWDPLKSKVHWAETISSIANSLGTTQNKMITMVQYYPVQVEPLACPGCEGRVHIYMRQMAQQALRGSIPLCNACATANDEERRRAQHEREQEFRVLERKTRTAFNSTICDDHRPEECISSLDGSAAALYLDMLKRYREALQQREYLGDDHRGRPIFADPQIVLCGPWAYSLGDKYEKSGPDLYALARHRLIRPLGYLAEAITLTRHGLINPSGYPYVSWAVEEELDGWPVIVLIGKQLRLLDDVQDHDNGPVRG